MPDFENAPVARPAAAPPNLPVAREVELPALKFPELRMPRKSAVFDILILLAVFFVVREVLGTMVYFNVFEFLSGDYGLFWGNAIAGVCVLATVGAIVRHRNQRIAVVGLTRLSFLRFSGATVSAFFSCYGAVIVAVPLYLILAGVDMQEMVQERGEFFEQIPTFPMGYLLAFCVFVGIHEEIMFRGLMLPRLFAITGSRRLAVIISSLIFGLMHFYQGPIGVVQTTAVGLVLASVATLSRNIWPAIATHAIFDMIGLALMPWAREMMKKVLEQATTAPMP